jgi:hypothetical protein
VQDRKELSRSLPGTIPRRGGAAMEPQPRIPVRPLTGDSSGHVLFLAVDQVSYFFRGSAVRLGLIEAHGGPLPDFLDDSVYVRTTKGCVYRAVHRSLTELAEQFGELLFSIHQSLLINVNAVVDAYLRADPHRVGMRAVPGVDYLAVSRRRVVTLRRLLMG